MKKLLKVLIEYKIAVVVLVIAAGIFAFNASYSIMPVTTGSMTPTMPTGTLAIVQPTTSLKLGEIIAFQPSTMAGPVTHRLVGYNKDGSLITKGDANAAIDAFGAPVLKSQVVGVVVRYIPVFAPYYWQNILLNLKGLIGVAILAITLLAIAIYAIKTRKKEEQGLPSEQTREPALTSNPV